MTNFNTITALKAILNDIDDQFFYMDWDGDDENGHIYRKVCTLDRPNEDKLMQIIAEIKELISDIAESEEVI